MANRILGWLGLNHDAKAGRRINRASLAVGSRRLHHEPLEDRCMLATLTVNVNGDGSVINDGNLMLREAIMYVNDEAQPGSLDIESNGIVHIDLTEPFGTNDTILFDPLLDGGRITLTEGTQLSITEAVTIDAFDINNYLPNGITIDATGNDLTPGVDDGQGSRVFNIDLRYSETEREVRLDGLTITGGDTDEDDGGGGIRFDGFTSATASSAKLTINKSTIVDNYSHSTLAAYYRGGGGISIRTVDPYATETKTSVLISESIVTGNRINYSSTDGGEGGGIKIFADDTQVEIRDSLIDDNHGRDGGGIAVYAVSYPDSSIRSHVIVANTTISNNTSTNEGGGLHAFLDGNSKHTADGDEQLTIEDSTFDNNTSNKGGGAFIATTYSSALINRSVVTGNEAIGTFHDTSGDGADTDRDGGGGLYLRIGRSDTDSDNKVTISESTISNNEANDDNDPVTANHSNGGGGIFATLFGIGPNTPDYPLASQFILKNSTISGNTALNSSGGGMLVSDVHSGTFTADQSTFSGNTADLNGGGISIERTAPKNENDPDSGNAFNAEITHSTFTDNRANGGGGVYSRTTENSSYYLGYQKAYVNASLSHTIISGNKTVDGTTASNLGGVFRSTSDYNLVGTTDGVFPLPASPNGNILSDDPGLEDLAFNGGFARTKTHMPMSDSLVIDKGEDPYLGSAEYDQRGDPFLRVLDGDTTQGAVIDIGAIEFRTDANGVPPKITNVELSGSDFGWTRDAFDFSEIVAAGNQFRAIPTTGIDTLAIYFSEEVVLDGSELVLSVTPIAIGGVPQPTTIVDFDIATDFTPGGNVATWTFDAPLVDGKYSIHLSDFVTDLAGNQLDAEWTNPDSGTLDDFQDDGNDPYFEGIPAFTPGDDTEGSGTDSEFRFHFALLAGDSNGNGIVEGGMDGADIISTDPTYGDRDGDDDIDADDEMVTTSKNGNQLPFRDTAGLGNDFEDNDVIDGMELTDWEVNFGQTATSGDFDGDSDVDGNDFLSWQLMFGRSSAWGSPLTGTQISPLFTEGAAPKVMNVAVSGSNSIHADYSFDTVDGSGQQLTTVPVGGADTISITFSELVDASGTTLEDSLDIMGLSTGNVPVLAEFSYDNITMTATWRFEEWAIGDHYVITLSDAVTDIEGDALDGEWTNPLSLSTTDAAVSEFPSGDDVAGGRFSFFMTLLPGDANLDGFVNAVDAGLLFGSWGSGDTFALGDFNGDGTTNAVDAGDMFANWTSNGISFQTVWSLIDFNDNGIIDQSDYDHVLDNIGMSNPTWADGDLNGDGVINQEDTDIAISQLDWDLLWVA